jgi:iron complex outermembrane recepter protein
VRHLLRTVVLLLACWPFARTALANDVLDLNLPAGSLSRALDRLASLTQLQILYDPDLVAGRETPGLAGSMSPERALERLLAPTDIGFTFTQRDAVALYRKRQTSAPPPPIVLSKPTPPYTQSPITVSAKRSTDDSYGTNTADTAMKSEGSALLAPVAFQSVTQSALRDQQAERLEDVLEGVSAIDVVASGQSAAGFAIRGFPTYQYYVDGVRVSPDLHHDGYRDLANVERIDLIKGPASTLYGRTEPGGLINIVTKQPLSESHLSLEEHADSFGQQRTQLDAGGPLNADGTLLYRFNAAQETGDSFRESPGTHRVFVAPVVTWAPTPDTQNTGYLEYLNSVDFNDAGLPMIGDRLPPVPINRNLTNSATERTSDLRMGIRGSHAFSNRWTERHHVDVRWLRTPQPPQTVPATDGLDPAACSLNRCPVALMMFASPVSTGRTYYGSMELLGTADLWSTRHSLLLGAELFDVRGHDDLFARFDPSLTIDLFHPIHMPLPIALLRHPDIAFDAVSAEQWNGVYIQDQITLSKSLRLLVGMRYDHVHESLRTSVGLPWATAGNDVRWDNAFKRRAGLLWNPTASFSVYTSYTENFGISTGLYSNAFGGSSSLLPPESAHEWEIGVKAEFFEGRAAGSLAWFDLKKLNIAQPDQNPLLAAQGFRIVTDAARSRGLELDFHGEIAPSLELIASYAYIDSKIAADHGTSISADSTLVPTAGNTGNRLFGVPRHGASAWIAYHRSHGLFNGLKLGAGAVTRSERQGDNENDYQLPGFIRCNALAAYGWRVAGARLSVQLNVDNVFDTRYFESMSGSHMVVPGAPRRWLGSIGVEF